MSDARHAISPWISPKHSHLQVPMILGADIQDRLSHQDKNTVVCLIRLIAPEFQFSFVVLGS